MAGKRSENVEFNQLFSKVYKEIRRAAGSNTALAKACVKMAPGLVGGRSFISLRQRFIHFDHGKAQPYFFEAMTLLFIYRQLKGHEAHFDLLFEFEKIAITGRLDDHVR